jgi:multidrug resistance efflux pump
VTLSACSACTAKLNACSPAIQVTPSGSGVPSACSQVERFLDATATCPVSGAVSTLVSITVGSLIPRSWCNLRSKSEKQSDNSVARESHNSPIDGLVADLHAREAALEVARVNLGYTQILAPADGTVGERQVRPGQLVSPGTQVMTFVENIRWVAANFRETQLTNIKVGDAAEIRVDVYPGKVFKGNVLEIAPASGSQFALLPPDNATGNFTKVVQRVPVKIALDDPTLASQLRPGLSAVVAVRTRH